MKKIAIIGGGVSGLTAGIYARKAGFDAEIYEKNAVSGGECTGWDRNGYHIDNCIHWLMGTNGDTELHKIWKTVGALDSGVHTPEIMYTSELNGQSVSLRRDIDRTEREMLALSPEDEKEIRSLMDACRLARKVAIPAGQPPELMNPVQLIRLARESGTALRLMKQYEGMDTSDLARKFHHPLLRAVLSDFCTPESMAQSFPMAYGNFVSGDGGIPVGGSRAMAQRMQKTFEDLGGRMYCSSPVRKIHVQNGRAAGMTLENGAEVQADYLIAANDPSYLFSVLLDRSYMDEVFADFYGRPEAYPVYAMFQAALAVDAPEDLLGGDVNLDVSDLRTENWMNSRMTLKTYAYEPSFAPEGRQIMQILYGGSTEAFDYFRELNRDPEVYRAKKYEIAQRLVGRIEERYPAYAGKLSILDVWTPLTYERWCNAYRGYNQACVITKHSRKNPYPGAWLKGVDNLVLAGQWLSPPGGLPGAAIQGKYAVQRILKKERRSIRL